MVQDDPVVDWDTMFSRGMDPDVADPTQCHSRPATPKKWPSKQETIAYALGVSMWHDVLLEVSQSAPMLQVIFKAAAPIFPVDTRHASFGA